MTFQQPQAGALTRPCCGALGMTMHVNRRINKGWFLTPVFAFVVSCAHHRDGELLSPAKTRSISRSYEVHGIPLPGTCKVHGIPLQEMLLPMHNNCTLPDEVYSSACAALFPHAPDLFLDPHDMSEPV